MHGNNLVCYLCGSEAVVKGCICDGSIKLIGSRCLSHHISDTDVDHNLVEPELASRMEADSSLMRYYFDELPTIQEAMRFLRASSDDVKKYKIEVDSARNYILSHIEELFSQYYERIQGTSEEISSHMKCLNKYKISLHDEGRILIENFRSRGSQALLTNIPSTVVIPVDKIVKYLSYILHNESSPSNSSLKLDLINDLMRDIEEKDKYLTLISIQLKEKDSRIEELSDTISHLNTQHSSLQATLLDSDRLIQEFKKQIEDEKVTFDDQISTKDNLIQKLRHQLSIQLQEKDARIDELSKIIQPSQPDINHLTSQLQVKSLKHQHTLTGHLGTVWSLCISSDSKWIISRSDDRSVRVWNRETGSQEALLTGYSDAVIYVCISNDSRWIISVSDDKSVRMWNRETGSQEALLTVHSDAVNSVCISSDIRWVIFGSEDNSVRVLNRETGSQETLFTGHSGWVSSVCISNDSRWIISGSADKSVRVWG